MKAVCVTGASGYIASWLVKFLLERGYTVKASVRDLNYPKKVGRLHLMELRRDFSCSKQTYWKKVLLMLRLMVAMVFFIQPLLSTMQSLILSCAQWQAAYS